MKASFYTRTKEILLSVPEITSVSMWQNNLINDTDRMNRFPLIFIQLQQISYNNMTHKVQECQGAQIVIHILFKALDAEDTGVFDVSQQIFIAMHRAGFRRLSEQPIYSGAEVIDWQITFEAPRFTDEDATIEKITTPAKPIEIQAQQTPL